LYSPVHTHNHAKKKAAIDVTTKNITVPKSVATASDASLFSGYLILHSGVQLNSDQSVNQLK
jgi:hypothetical protein